MSVGLLVTANGRGELLAQMMASLAQYLPPFPVTFICDDSGSPLFADWLCHQWPDAKVDAHRHLGHGPAIARAWGAAARLPVDHVLWMEEDMLLCQPIDLEAIAAVVDDGPVQMVLKRSAHFPLEVETGGMLERFGRDAFSEHEQWMEHRLFYSLNPNIVSTAFLCAHRWPPRPNSEHHFGRALFRDPSVHVGMWGRWEDEPIVEHAGVGPRTGTGY